MFQSRKFRAMLFDICISTAIYFIGRYADPEIAEDALWLIGAWQPVVLAYILGTAYEDGQMKRNVWLDTEPPNSAKEASPAG